VPTVHNPYLLHDVNIIVSAYIDPLAEEENVGGKKVYDQALVDNISFATGGGRIMHWITGGLANAAAGLQEQLDEAKATVDALYSYGTRSQPDANVDIDLGLTTLQGVNISNTLYTMIQADNIGDAMKTLVADCVPCQDRILTLLSVNPVSDVLSIVNRSYQRMMNFLVQLFDLVLGDHSVEIFADVCSLLKFLHFMCLPDLFRLIIVLSRLISKYSMKLKEIQLTFSAILGRIAGPALTPLATLMDKYIQLIMAPVECMVDSIDAQLQSIDVVQAWKRGFGGNQKAERTFTMKEVAGPLRALKKYLQDSVDEIHEEFAKLQKNIDDWLQVMDEKDKQMFDVSQHIANVARLIGLVQAVIYAIQQGVVICGPSEGASEEALEGFLKDYIGPQFDLSITTDNGIAKIRPRVPEGLNKIFNVVGTYKKTLEKQDLPTTAEQKAPSTIGQVVVPLKNCLYTTTDAELEQVKDFLGAFQEGE